MESCRSLGSSTGNDLPQHQSSPHPQSRIAVVNKKRMHHNSYNVANTTPYLDVMTFRHSHLLKDGIEEIRHLMVDPILIPDLEHTGVQPSLDFEDHFIFNISTSTNCKKCGKASGLCDSPARNNEHNSPKHRSPHRSSHRREGNNTTIRRIGGEAAEGGKKRIGGEEGGNEDEFLGRPEWDTTTSVVHPSSSAGGRMWGIGNNAAAARKWNAWRKDGGSGEGGGRGGATVSSATAAATTTTASSSLSPNRGHKKVSLSPPLATGEAGDYNSIVMTHQDGGRYDLNGVKTLRKKPTADAQARSLIHTLRSTAQQMSLLVYQDT